MLINMNIFCRNYNDKNLFSEKYGNLDLQSNYKTHKYDTNKLTNFFVNSIIEVQILLIWTLGYLIKF